MRLPLALERALQSLLDTWFDLGTWIHDRLLIEPRSPRPGSVVEPDRDGEMVRIQGSRLSGSAILVGPSPLVTIEPPQRAAWDERGWQRRVLGATTAYEGQYQVRKRDGTRLSFWGHIRVAGRVPTAYIADPPAEIRSHPKGACFQLAQAPWFRVHWQRPPGNIDDALLYVERVLSEALN